MTAFTGPSTNTARGAARRLRRSAASLAVAGACLLATPLTASAAPAAPAAPSSTAAAFTSASRTTDTSPYSVPVEFIDPTLLEAIQPSIVGLVIVWEEPDAPSSMWTATDPLTPTPTTTPALSICTGFFDTASTIATAGHCVDPKIGREMLDQQNLPFDPDTGQMATPPPGRPDPTATVFAFQPHEAGGVLDTPVIVHVEDYRSVDDGDTASLSVAGLPPATPLPVAATDPRIGEPVTSIGYAGLNLYGTDGVDLGAFGGPGGLDAASMGQSVARMLQDSRLQPVNTSGTITSRQYRGGVPVYQVSADFDQGMSGGPTINSRGEVYGLNSQMTVPFFGQNFNVITDTAMLRRALHHNADTIPTTDTDPTTGTADTTSDGHSDGTNGAPAEATSTANTNAGADHASDDHPSDDHGRAGRVDYSGALLSLLTGLAGIGLGWGIARRTRPHPTDGPTGNSGGANKGGGANSGADDASARDAGAAGEQHGR